MSFNIQVKIYHFSQQRSLATELTTFHLEHKTQALAVISGLILLNYYLQKILVPKFEMMTFCTHTYTHLRLIEWL